MNITSHELKNTLHSVAVDSTTMVLDLLGNTIDVRFRHAETYKPASKWLTRVKKTLLHHGLRKPGKNATINKFQTNDFWYIISSESKHFIDFMEPFSNETLVNWEFIGHEAVSNRNFNTNYIHPYCFQSYKRVRKNCNSVFQDLKQFCANIEDEDLIEELLYTVEINLFRYVNAKCWIQQLQPKAILTEYDRNPKTAPWISAAKSLCISTYTLTHGSTMPIDNYVPLIAQNVFVWGEDSATQFLKGGVSASSIVVGGNPRAKYELAHNTLDIRSKWSILQKDTVAILILNNIRLEWRFQLVELFASVMKQQTKLILKLHPQEKKSDYASLPDRILKNITLVEADEMNADEAMALGDFFVGHNSIMLLECLLMGKPVVIMDIIPMECGIGRELGQRGGMPIVRSKDEYKNTFDCMLDPDFRNKLVGKAASFIQSHCIRRDKVAAKYISEYILDKA